MSPLVPPQKFRKTEGIHRVGLAANKPPAADVLVGTLYYSSDTLTLERSNGLIWETYAGTGSGTGGSANTFPLYNILDDFNRANESPLAGNWGLATQLASTALNLVSNRVTTSFSGASYWKSQFDINFNIFVDIPLLTVTTSAFIRIELITNPPVDENGFRLELSFTGGTYNFSLFRVDSAIATLIGAITPISITSGGAIGFERNGTNLKTWWRDVTGIWTKVHDVTNTGYQVPLYGCLKITNSSDWALDNFGGGPIHIGTNTPHHTTHETGGTDAIVSIAGDIITSGTVNDARLSTNVPLKNTLNTFTADQAITKTTPVLYIVDSIQAVDAKVFRISNTGLALRFNALNDALTANVGAIPLILDRSGNATVGNVLLASGGLGATPLNASQLTSGLIPDAAEGYSVGNFTPVFAGGTTAGSHSYSAQIGSFLKIKSFVFVSIQVDITSKGGTVAGNATIINLPFPLKTGAAQVGFTPVYMAGVTLPAGCTQFAYIMNPATSTVVLFGLGSGSVAAAIDSASQVSSAPFIRFNGCYITN